MKKLIMVVDDDNTIRHTLNRVLNANGYATVEAFSGSDCLKKLESIQVKPDLILLDLMMQDMDGTTAFYKIREKYPDIKIVVLSALQPSWDIDELLKKDQAISHITKPFNNPFLINSLKKLFGEE